MKKNIVLIGMPAVGKSTIGVILAKELGYQFIDSDLLIQEREKRLLHEIIEEEGVDGFLRIEDEVNASIETEGAVIATGGSAVYGEKSMKHLKEISKIVYLELPYQELSRRLKNIKGRGVVLREGLTLEDLFEERRVLYEKYADLVIHESGRNIEETLEVLLNCLK
ncbi:MAG: shikimate kinase [Eubacterium sp.]|nr:shikimate kinase [Eubacterium sp.]